MKLVLGLFRSRGMKFTPAIKEAERRGYNIRVMSSLFRFDPALIFQAWSIVRDSEINIIQSHGYKSALIAWALKKITGISWIAFAHGYTNENWKMALYNCLDRWLMAKADRVVVVSSALGNSLATCGVSRSAICVIHNSINQECLAASVSGDKFRRLVQVGTNELLVGVIGRLSREKGQGLFLDAFREVSRTIPQARAVLVGEGPDEGHLRAKVVGLGLESTVSIAGYQADISSIYGALDLVVIPSYSEGLPNVLLEAMIHGKAVVTTSVGGIPEVLPIGLRRWMVPPGEVQPLARAISDALADEEMRREWGRSGCAHVREHFSPQERARQVLALYREVCGLRGSES